MTAPGKCGGRRVDGQTGRGIDGRAGDGGDGDVTGAVEFDEGTVLVSQRHLGSPFIQLELMPRFRRQSDLRRSLGVIEFQQAFRTRANETFVVRRGGVLGQSFLAVPGRTDHVGPPQVAGLERDNNLRVDFRQDLKALIVVGIGAHQGRPRPYVLLAFGPEPREFQLHAPELFGIHQVGDDCRVHTEIAVASTVGLEITDHAASKTVGRSAAKWVR